ncbi:MAG: CPBP family intramembrane glutamic endopeptidase [Gammaproteobacteria bacterium]|nr:CPBP family intramembrane glutamic endopeptidase [Gammaproteobacteria bacterium]
MLNINNFSSLGFSRKHFTKIAVRSWLFGLIMLVPISILFLSCGFRLWEPVPQSLLEPLLVFASALVSASIIGLIEETLFRGLLQSQLTSVMNSLSAIIIVSIIYSSVHFLQAPDYDLSNGIHWYSGFILLSTAFANFSNAGMFLDAWFALFLAGIFLSLVRLRTNNILWCIGIHAGWVTHIKVFKDFTDRDNSAECGQFASNYDNYVGEFSAIWILFVICVWALLYFRKSSTT